MFNTGDVVRFREPLTREEEGERFEVLEMRGERVLVVSLCDLPIPPTYVYLAADLERVPTGTWLEVGLKAP